MNKIIVFCELNEAQNDISSCSYELISKAFHLSKQAQELANSKVIVEAVCCCECDDIGNKEKIFSSGADKFVLITNKNIKKHNSDIIKDTFLEYFNNNNQSDVILFPATMPMRHCAPCVTVNLDCGLVADCIDLGLILKDEKLMLSATRPTFGSELMATIINKKLPQCATIRPETFKNEILKDSQGEFIKLESEIGLKHNIKVLSSVLLNSSSDVDLENAKIILCAGYGLNTPDREYYKKLQKIAKLTNSQIGCTRKVVDFGIMEHKFQIGLTGATVKPNLYITFGVSGAIQHVCGIKNSKKIISINTDENAEIFKYSDYKIIGNAKSLIDEILSKIHP